MENKKVWNATDASPEVAIESPLEEGVFLYPANTVETEPPKFDFEKQVCQWDGTKWVVSDIPKIVELAQEVENICHQYVIALKMGEPKNLSFAEMKKILEKVKNYKSG